jgi:hypothetical protein
MIELHDRLRPGCSDAVLPKLADFGIVFHRDTTFCARSAAGMRAAA